MKTYMKYLLFIAIIFLLVFLSFAIPVYQGIHGRKVLLQETNLPELLKSGREIINQAEREGCFTKYYGRIDLPKDIKIPKIIHRLQLKLFGLGGRLTIDRTRRLSISFSSHMAGYFGVCIYSENFVKPEESVIYRYGDKELLPGLWYIDNEFSPKYDKKIDKMIKKNKYLKKSK